MDILVLKLTVTGLKLVILLKYVREHFKMSTTNSTDGNIRFWMKIGIQGYFSNGTVRPKFGNSNFVPID